MSFCDIKKIIQKINGRANDDDINLNNKSKATQAMFLYVDQYSLFIPFFFVEGSE